MLFHSTDRHARSRIRVGDTLKLPLNLPRMLDPRVDEPYRHGTFDVIAFPVFGTSNAIFAGCRPMAHCITLRRRCDGWTTTLAAHYWEKIRAAYEGDY